MKISIVFLLAFVTTLAFQFHGFSMASWNQIAPQGTWSEPLVGKARNGRSDDWMAQLPAMISQSLDNPSFPEINHLIHPEGHEMLLGMNVPVKSWIAFFKPTTWGYFLSPDFGLSWHWQFRIFLLLGAAYTFFVGVMGASTKVSLWAAFCLLSSSFFAYWSYISEPITGLGLLAAILVFYHLKKAPRNLWRLALLYWVLVSFCVNNLYPPFQVPMVYFVLAVGIYTLSLKGVRLRRLFEILLIVFFALLTVGFHFYENLPALQKILSTEYPGLRVSTGGNLSVGRAFLMTFAAVNGYSSFTEIHISETGSSYFVGFVALFLFGFSWKSLSEIARKQFLLWGLMTLALGIYSFVGIPEFIAKISGWSRVPGPRTLGLWTLLNICWLVCWMQHRPQLKEFRKKLLFGAGCALFIFFLSFDTKYRFEFLTGSKILPAIFLFALCGVLLMQKPKWGMGLVLSILVGGSVWFNPIDRKSHSRILNSELVHKLKLNFEASGKKAFLLLDGDIKTCNFARMVGIPSYGGMHFVPQLNFWKSLDPQGKYTNKYNRFAHVIFLKAPQERVTYFENPSGDVLRVFLSDADLNKLDKDAWIREKLF